MNAVHVVVNLTCRYSGRLHEFMPTVLRPLEHAIEVESPRRVVVKECHM
jgi:hypothetical protein